MSEFFPSSLTAWVGIVAVIVVATIFLLVIMPPRPELYVEEERQPTDRDIDRERDIDDTQPSLLRNAQRNAQNKALHGRVVSESSDRDPSVPPPLPTRKAADRYDS